MKVREVMTTDNLLSIGEDDSLAAAAHRMTWTPCRHLPVVRDGQVVGVISERDILARLADSRRLDGPSDLVRTAMAKPPVVADPEADIGEAAARMLSHRVGCLPVVTNGKLIGMLTRGDLLGRIVAEMYTPPLDRG
ncbi:MAG TPA: CBS domain-containing protein [Polyangia bacterium]|nr:CBS domain-containing protein [Polyangia bacterium]